MTGTQASLPAQARHSPALFPPSPLDTPVSQGKGQGSSGGTDGEGRLRWQGGGIAALSSSSEYGNVGSSSEIAAPGEGGTAIPLAVVTFHLFTPAANLIWSLERLQWGSPHLHLRRHSINRSTAC